MVWIRQIGEAPGALPPDPRDLSHQASGPGRQPGGGLPVTLTVWPTFGAPVASQQSRILRKAGQILAQTAPATGIFQDRQRKVLNYPVVLRMGSGQQQLLDKATKIDILYGSQFKPPVGG